MLELNKLGLPGSIKVSALVGELNIVIVKFSLKGTFVPIDVGLPKADLAITTLLLGMTTLETVALGGM